MSDINTRVEQFIKLRDKVADIRKKHTEELKPYVETLEQLNGVMLQHLQNQGAKSVRTDAGTIYETEKKSAPIADMAAFWTWVVTSGNFDIIDRKANVTAVFEYINEHGRPPPGVNANVVKVAGVRRAPGT